MLIVIEYLKQFSFRHQYVFGRNDGLLRTGAGGGATIFALGPYWDLNVLYSPASGLNMSI
jgi:hypothetical protein